MILQELKKYYDNKRLAKPDEFSVDGYGQYAVPFLIVVKPNGDFVNLEDTRMPREIELRDKKTGEKKTKTIFEPTVFWLPQALPRSGKKSFETTFLLWDHIGYVLGFPETDEKSPLQHQTWIDSLHALPDDLKKDEGVAAMIRFYEKDGIEKVKVHPAWQDCAKKPGNIAFKLAGDLEIVPEREAVKNFVLQSAELPEETEGGRHDICLVTGKRAETVRTFQAVSFGGEVAKLVSFQKDSGYDSYGKEQGSNAPIGKGAESAYISALKMLLNSEQRITINATTFLFWAETPDPFEQQVADIMSYDPDRRTPAVTALLKAPFSGTYTESSLKRRFCILGISPNKARIIVQYWKCSTIEKAAKNIREYFDLMDICHWNSETPSLSIRRIMKDIAPGEEMKNLPTSLERDFIRSIFDGGFFSRALLQAAILRNRAKQQVTRPRAALIKAYLNQLFRIDPKNKLLPPNFNKELTVSLDKENKNIGYLLGRLFAVLLKTQKDAEPGGNSLADIKDRFYGAASGTPSTVFPMLIRKVQHHLSKIAKSKKGLAITLEKDILEIMGKIPGNECQSPFPSNLTLEEQGCFAVGYYHQVLDSFTSKKDKSEETA